MRSLAIFLVLLAVPAMARADDVRAGDVNPTSNAAKPFRCDSVLASDCFNILFRRLETERLKRNVPAHAGCDAAGNQQTTVPCDNDAAAPAGR